MIFAICATCGKKNVTEEEYKEQFIKYRKHIIQCEYCRKQNVLNVKNTKTYNDVKS